jgi:hypothetical protein
LIESLRLAFRAGWLNANVNRACDFSNAKRAAKPKPMSFKLFIYHCAVCAAWAALGAWLVTEWWHLRELRSLWARSLSIGCVVGVTLATAVGALDALLNAVGKERWVRVLVCLGVGGLGGLLGGALGQLLQQVVDRLEELLGTPLGRLLQQLGLARFLGWMTVGMAIGASIAVYDLTRALRAAKAMPAARRKLRNGLAGGAIGGALGGFLFEQLSTLERLPGSSLALGLVILGASIGLLVGLAQIVRKEAWIRVEKGFRAGREMMLSKVETTIGRAESCDIGLFGDDAVERGHARILLERNRYVLADAGSAGGTFINDQRIAEPTPLHSGDLIRVGHSLLRFGERQKRPNR